MSRQVFSRPILSIDLKKNRIRIHKQTLHLLGDPEYIQLLINPSSHRIAIRQSIPQDHLAHRISQKQLIDKESYELYSLSLIRSLKSINRDWKSDKLYRIYGTFDNQAKVAIFTMTETVIVTEK